MKKILLSLFILTSIGSIYQLNAQGGACTVTTPIISNIVTNPGPNPGDPCTITFDIEFDLTSNGGNKYVAMYIYSGNSLPAGFYGANGKKVPSGTQVNAASTILATVQINTDISTVKTTSSYAGGGSNLQPSSFKPSLDFTTTLVVGNTSRILIKGVTVVVADCSVQAILKADVGASQGSSFQDFQCLVQGLQFVANDPILAGLMFCTNPRSFTFSAKTTSTTNITFSAYSDAAHTQLLSAPAGFTYSGYGTNAPIAITQYQNITLSSTANTATSFGQFPITTPNISRIYLVVKAASVSNTSNLTIENTCTVLPVNFKSFNASRTTSSNVAITWTTAMEQNSKGFNVQKNVGGEWKTIAFVFSQAEGGNSSSELSYSFKDANQEKGITQYRIQQVDIDGNAKYSDIKAIRGESTVSKIVVYPNPSVDGKVNVVFEDNAIRDVQINDMQGRIVKSFKGISNNILVIEKLTSGFYTIKVTNRNTAASSVEKVVVKSR